MKNYFKEIKWFVQRGRYGYADCDVWDIRHYLSEMLPKLLRNLKGGVGCPSDFYDSKAENNECHKWDEALEAMAQGFEAVKFLDTCGYHRWIDNEKGGKRLEIDQKAIDNAKKKMDKGLKLFADNFLGLWD